MSGLGFGRGCTVACPALARVHLNSDYCTLKHIKVNPRSRAGATLDGVDERGIGDDHDGYWSVLLLLFFLSEQNAKVLLVRW